MPSVTLEVSALVIVLVERDAQPVVVEVDRPVQVLDFEEDLFDTNESHGLPPPSVENGDLLSASACSRQKQARRQPIWTSAPWQNTDLPEQVCIVEVDPRMTYLRVLYFHDRATVIARLTSGGQNVAQWAEVGAARAPANHHMAVTGSQHLLDVEVQIGKRCQIDLEELTRAFVSRERRGKDVRFPRRLRVYPLDEAFHVMSVPRSEDLPSDMEVVLSSHRVLLWLARLRSEVVTPHPPSPARTAYPSRGTSSPPWSGALGPARACPCAGRACRGRGGSGPAAGAWRALRLGRAPAGSALRPARSREDRAALQYHRGDAWHERGGPVLGAHGQAPVPARRARPPRPGGPPIARPSPCRDEALSEPPPFPLPQPP